MTSALQAGNRALRDGDLAAAAGHYLRAEADTPELLRFAANNLAAVQRAWLASRADRERPRVAVAGSDLARDADRALALAEWHAGSADVELLGWQAGVTIELPAGLKRSFHPRHVLLTGTEPLEVQALALAAAHPADLLQLVAPTAANVLLALLHRLLWGSRVAFDFHRPPAARAVASVDSAPTTGLHGAEWRAFALAVAAGLDAVTVASAAGFESLPWAIDTTTTVALGLQAVPDPWPAPEALRSLSSLALPPLVRELVRLTLPATTPGSPSLSEAMPVASELVSIEAPTPRAEPVPPIAPRAPREPAVVRPFRPAAVVAPSEPAAADWTPRERLRPRHGRLVVELLGDAIGLLDAASLDAAVSAAADQRLSDAGAFLRLHAPTALPALRSSETASAWTSESGAPSCRMRWDAAGLMLADAWFTTDATLRLRLHGLDAGGDGTATRVLRAFQVDAGAATLRAVAERPLAGTGPHFVDVRLARPLYPLLFVVGDAEGRWLDGTVLPFPSLCRGGTHHGELMATGAHAEPMANLAGLSTAWMTEHLGNAPCDDALGTIEVDLEGATGAERLLSTPVKEWLADLLRLTALRPKPGSAEGPAMAFLEGACTLPATPSVVPRGGRMTLSLPADALPTIGVLVSRRLAPNPASTWIVATPATGRPRAVVTVPAPDSALLALQPAGRAASLPLLRHDDGAGRGVALPPLALRFADATPPSAAALLQPVAIDAGRPLLRGPVDATVLGAATVTVLLPWHQGAADPTPLLESLSRQTHASAVHAMVVLPRACADKADRWQPLLQRTFGDRFTILASDGATPSARLNDAAARSHGNHLLIAEPGMLLHDPRTLSTLLALALAPRVASAACTVLREVAMKKGSEVRLFSGGVFPSRLSFHGSPALEFVEPNTAAAFPCATYPVAANAFRLALVSAAAWKALGGLDAANFPDHRADLDFCLRALRDGWRHLCTGVVSAAANDGGAGERHVDSHGAAFMAPQRWHEVLASVSVLRDFEA